MRKIGSEKDVERKKKRNLLIAAFFMLGILVFGTVGYGFFLNPGANRNTNEGNTIPEGTAINVGNRWAVNIQGQIFYFSNSPKSVENVPVEIINTINGYAGKVLYLDIENNAVLLEVSSTLGRYASRVQEACYLSCPERNVPEKDCSENLIIWQDSIENKVYQEDNCVFIEGDLIAADAFLYELFGLNTP